MRVAITVVDKDGDQAAEIEGISVRHAYDLALCFCEAELYAATEAGRLLDASPHQDLRARDGYGHFDEQAQWWTQQAGHYRRCVEYFAHRKASRARVPGTSPDPWLERDLYSVDEKPDEDGL